MIIGQRELLCMMCDKRLNRETMHIVQGSGGWRKHLILCVNCARYLKEWEDTINEYGDEEQEGRLCI